MAGWGGDKAKAIELQRKIDLANVDLDKYLGLSDAGTPESIPPGQPQAQPSGAPVKVSGPQDPVYLKLPSGSPYIGTDGVRAYKK